MNYKKLTKSQVRSKIRNDGRWEGIIAGNKVNEYHLEKGWCLGYRVEFLEIDEMEKKLNNVLYYLDPELGTRIAFYEIEK